MKTVSVGIIGCGKIAPAYIKGLADFPFLRLAAVADLNEAFAQQRAAEFGVRALTVAALLADAEIEIVLNLTIPQAHGAVSQQILAAGKHVYVEKPLALDVAEGAAVLAAAQAAGRQVSAAPDTVLGAGQQQARQLLDAGAIGRPVSATAFMMSRGVEHWHPNPGFYYQVGGGPLLDMGPYYLTALVTLLGPIASVTAEASRAYTERTILSEPRRGEVMAVEIDTHTTALFRFAQGTLATTIFSFDIAAGANLPRIEIYGTEGTLVVPDPNTFGGDVLLRRRDEKDFAVIPSEHTHRTQRGTGVADLAHHLHAGSPFRARGDVAQHVLEAMQACATSAASGQRVFLTTAPDRPAPVPPGLPAGHWA